MFTYLKIFVISFVAFAVLQFSNKITLGLKTFLYILEIVSTRFFSVPPINLGTFLKSFKICPGLAVSGHAITPKFFPICNLFLFLRF